MKKYLLILMSFVLIMAASCTKETMAENPDRKSVGTEASNKTKALDYLDRLLEDLYGENARPKAILSRALTTVTTPCCT